MLCQKCKQKAATVRYTYSMNGKGAAYSLCEDCYRALAGTESLFSGWLFPGTAQSMPAMREIKKCDLCGYSFDRIAHEGRVGCARCYRTFEKELSPLIARIHGNKVYVHGEDIDTERSELEKLQAEMEKAIKEENFEEAAILRDKIKALKEETE